MEQEMLQEILDELQKLSTRVSQIESDMVRKNDISDMVHKDDIVELQQMARALRDGQEELKAQMESMSLDIHKLVGRQTRQENIISTLSMRSIEQESELRQLKKVD